MYYLLMTIGERLKALRERKKLTLEGLGKIVITDEKPAGYTKQAVSAWEANRNQLTSTQIAALCRIFSITADELLFGVTPHLKMTELNGLEGHLITMYRQLVEDQRDDLLSLISDLVNASHPTLMTRNNPYPEHPLRRNADKVLAKAMTTMKKGK